MFGEDLSLPLIPSELLGIRGKQIWCYFVTYLKHRNDMSKPQKYETFFVLDLEHEEDTIKKKWVDWY